MLGRIVVSLGLLLAAASGAMAQQGVNSVNGFTAAQRAKAEAAARAAGYTPSTIADVQGGYIFMWVRKAGAVDAILTIAPDGTVVAGGVAIATPPGPRPELITGLPQ